MLYDSNHMTFWNRQNYGDSRKISGCQGQEVGSRDEQAEHKEFLEQLNILYIIEYTTPRMNAKVNYGLRMIMMCQCSFINCNKCITLVEDAGSGQGCEG